MAQAKTQPPMQKGSSDDFQTPSTALLPLLPYLNDTDILWECAEGKGFLKKALNNWGYKCIGTDIKTGYDFLSMQPCKCNAIITNPPFSLKQRFIERCYEIGKPFALLLPLTTLETAKRQYLFAKYGVQIILFDKRINFVTPSGEGTGSWFASAWFTWGLGLESQLNFVSLKTESKHPTLF